jgi:hypothetical protein
MKKLLYCMLAICFFAPIAGAQNHVEAGVFVDYFRVPSPDLNLVGVGGRLSFNVNHYAQLEAEMGYDFNQAFTEGFSNTSGSTVSFQNTNARLLRGLFGPKIQTNKGPVRLFFTAKGGFTNFSLSAVPASASTFTSSVSNLRSDNVNAVFYPGVGAEAFLGPIGLRLDVGDEMVFLNNGIHHNLGITFGPTIRF